VNRLTIEHLAIVETLIAEMSAIEKIADPGSATVILCRHCLGLLGGLQNDLEAESDSPPQNSEWAQAPIALLEDSDG